MVVQLYGRTSKATMGSMTEVTPRAEACVTGNCEVREERHHKRVIFIPMTNWKKKVPASTVKALELLYNALIIDGHDAECPLDFIYTLTEVNFTKRYGHLNEKWTGIFAQMGGFDARICQNYGDVMLWFDVLQDHFLEDMEAVTLTEPNLMKLFQDTYMPRL